MSEGSAANPTRESIEKLKAKKATRFVPYMVLHDGDFDVYKHEYRDAIEPNRDRLLAEIKEAYEAENWREYISQHFRARKFDALMEVVFYQQVQGPELWQCVADTWRGMQLGTYGKGEVWTNIYRLYGDDRLEGMRPPEREVYDALPDYVTLYRGAKPESRKGMLWYLDIEKAREYAQKWEGRTYQVTVPKEAVLIYYNSVDMPDDDEIFVYFNSTWEDVVVDPNYLDESKITEVHPEVDTPLSS
jgi:hypothetical protein